MGARGKRLRAARYQVGTAPVDSSTADRAPVSARTSCSSDLTAAARAGSSTIRSSTRRRAMLMAAGDRCPVPYLNYLLPSPKVPTEVCARLAGSASRPDPAQAPVPRSPELCDTGLSAAEVNSLDTARGTRHEVCGTRYACLIVRAGALPFPVESTPQRPLFSDAVTPCQVF